MSKETTEMITLRGQSAWANWLRKVADQSGYGLPRTIEKAVSEFAATRSLAVPPPRLPRRGRPRQRQAT